ncbi:MAG: hypothetical protein ABID61_04185 [Candidatus Micrarchaeota archaeon]
MAIHALVFLGQIQERITKPPNPDKEVKIMALETYEIVNTAWKSTSKILFGQEIGELKDFAEYMHVAVPGKSVVSTFSGKSVWVASNSYS